MIDRGCCEIARVARLAGAHDDRAGARESDGGSADRRWTAHDAIGWNEAARRGRAYGEGSVTVGLICEGAECDRLADLPDGERAGGEGGEAVICGRQRSQRGRDRIGAIGAGARRGGTECRGACDDGRSLTINEASERRGERRIGDAVITVLGIGGDGEWGLADGQGAVGESEAIVGRGEAADGGGDGIVADGGGRRRGGT